MSSRIVYFSEETTFLNNRIQYFTDKTIKKSDLLAQRKLLLADKRFKEAILEARSNLGLAYVDPEDHNLGYFSRDEEVEDNQPKLNVHDDAVIRESMTVLEKTHMPTGWLEYVCEFIVNDGWVEELVVESQVFMEAIEIDKDTITIEVRRGISAEQYRAAWPALKPFLEKLPSDYLTTEENFREKIYFASERGMGISEICKEYLSREYAIDPQSARDKVKKIIKRYRKKL